MNDKQPHQSGQKRPEERDAWICAVYDCPLTEPVNGTWADMQEHCRAYHPHYKGLIPVCKL